jgi:uncharacterized protein YgiM (DUF1202 family)
MQAYTNSKKNRSQQLLPPCLRRKTETEASNLKNTLCKLFCRNCIIVILIAILAQASFAQETPTLVEKSALEAEPNAPSTPAFPYIAEITGNDVYIRSGPGTDHYYCGKLNVGDRVKIVSSQFGWSRIVPPVDCFSWIPMQYISVNIDDPSIGTVTGNNVRVYAGSDYFEPIHSNAIQLRLNRSDKVKLLGEEKDSYYKISPPTGAYLWVSTQYTKPIRPVEQAPPTAVTTSDANAPVTSEISNEQKLLEKFYDLQKKIEAEQAKPLEEQNYSDMKKALLEISENKQAQKAARFAEFAINQIESFELASAVSKELKLQNEQLKKVKEKIDKAHQKKLQEVEDLGRFAIIGQLQSSSIYDTEGKFQHYRIIDETGKTICYARPTSEALKIDLSNFIDKKVGLVGTIQPHPPTAGALTLFSEIVELK